MRYVIATAVWAAVTGLGLGVTLLVGWQKKKYEGLDTELPESEMLLIFLGDFLSNFGVSLSVLLAMTCFVVGYFWPSRH